MNLFLKFLLSLLLTSATTCFALDIYVSRGITTTPEYRAQENTLDAILAIDKWNHNHLDPRNKIAGSEIHVVVVPPIKPTDKPIFICSHDENLKDLIGIDLDLHKLTAEQKAILPLLKIKQILNNIDYGKTRNFAFFDQVLDATMKGQPFMIWLNVKDKDYRPSPDKTHGYTSVELIKAMKIWREKYLKERNIDIFKYIIISSDNPFIVEELYQEADTSGLITAGLNVFPDYSDFGLPAKLWDIFFAAGGYEKLLKLYNTHWVSLQKSLITPQRINNYHARGIKVIGWGYNDIHEVPKNEELDVILLTY